MPTSIQSTPFCPAQVAQAALGLHMPPGGLPAPAPPTIPPTSPPTSPPGYERPDEVNPQHPPEIDDPSLPGEHMPVREPQPLAPLH